MFASQSRLFALSAGMQMLLTLLSGAPHLECACCEGIVGLMPGNRSARSSSCCCSSSLHLMNFDETSDGPKSETMPCCRRSHACSKDKIAAGVCATHQSGCHCKVVPPDAATRVVSQPVSADAANLWFALVAPAISDSWLNAEMWGSNVFWPEPSGPPTACLHRVLRI